MTPPMVLAIARRSRLATNQPVNADAPYDA